MGYLIVLANDVIAIVGLAAIFFTACEPPGPNMRRACAKDLLAEQKIDRENGQDERKQRIGDATRH
jgi:hypothetical protein